MKENVSALLFPLLPNEISSPLKINVLAQVGYTPVITVPQKLKKENWELQASLGNIVKL